MTAPTDPFDPVAWQAQEQARRSERLQLDPRGDDAADRLVARALRSAPLPPLPADFAADVARLVQAPARADAGVERWLTTALVTAFVIAGCVVALLYGADWWRASADLLARGGSPSASGWMLAAAGCAGLSWISAQVRRRAAH